MSEVATAKVIGVVVCDFARAGIGTKSRLGQLIGGKRVVQHVVERLLKVEGLSEIVLLVPADQMWEAHGLETNRVRVMELVPRGEGAEARMRAGRRWNLSAWRGGAGQWTVFDEEYHPAGVARACADCQADHVLVVHSHGIFLDVDMTSALVRHHLHKNLDMKVTFTPSAPGLCGMVLRGDIVREMGDKGAMPWQLLAYDPAAPAYDTLVREACMQVDPAVSKIPNRFCVDTDRGWAIAEWLLSQEKFGSAAEMAVAAARGVAPGVRDLERISEWPREVEVELTGKRLTNGPGSVPALVREARGELDAHHWRRWLERGHVWDDVLLTIGGDGDPLLYGDLVEVLHAARTAGFGGICVQTDLAAPEIDNLLEAINLGFIDVLSVTMYGHSAPVYANVAGVDLHGVVMAHLTKLAPLISARGGVPLVVPRLIKVRETIPEMEPFFDLWIKQSGWAVLDGPTDRAGGLEFRGVVDMSPPKRKACRRIWDRMLVRANGVGVACDEDMMDRLAVGNIESMGLKEMWQSMAFQKLRGAHAAGNWGAIDPCKNCREWHRA